MRRVSCFVAHALLNFHSNEAIPIFVFLQIEDDIRIIS